MIPLANPKANYLAHQYEIIYSIRRVLDAGTYIGGVEVESFEKEFAEFIGVKHAIGVNSGTDALIIAMKSLDMENSIISVRADTALATVSAIINIAAVPFLVRPGDITDIAVHLYGNVTPFAAATIEDCAQACGGMFNGQRLGTLSTIGCFSFYPTKNLGAVGDGGMIVTSDARIATACRQIREYGWNRKRTPQRIGVNSRLDPIQAAILRVKLKYLDKENERRRDIALRYNEGLKNIVQVPDPTNHCFHLYVIECDNRNGLAKHLKQADIQTGIHYPRPIHKEPVYMDYVKIGADLSKVEQRAKRILSLPMYPELKDDEVDRVIEGVRSYYC